MKRPKKKTRRDKIRESITQRMPKRDIVDLNCLVVAVIINGGMTWYKSLPNAQSISVTNAGEYGTRPKTGMVAPSAR